MEGGPPSSAKQQHQVDSKANDVEMMGRSKGFFLRGGAGEQPLLTLRERLSSSAHSLQLGAAPHPHPQRSLTTHSLPEPAPHPTPCQQLSSSSATWVRASLGLDKRADRYEVRGGSAVLRG